MSTPGVGNMVVGGVICVVGIGITLATYSAASGGGRFVVAWGAIAVGAIVFVLGAISALQHEAASNRRAAPAGHADSRGGDARHGARAGPSGRFSEKDWMLIQALASVMKDPAMPSAAEIGAISSIMQTLGRPRLSPELDPCAEVRDIDVHMAAFERRRDPDDIATWFGKRAQVGSVFWGYKWGIAAGCLAVVMAGGRRPHALATAITVGQALGLGESEVRQHLGDKADPFNGKSLARDMKIAAAEAVPGREVEFHTEALRTCASCKGFGCKACGEEGRVRSKRALMVTLPQNVHDGVQIKSPGFGDDPLPGGRPGDLTITIKVEPAAKAPVRDGPVNGAAVEVILKLAAARVIGGRKVEFHYDAMTLCAMCQGSGCSACGEQGRTLTKQGVLFTLPADVHDGMRLQWPGFGDAPLPGGEPGDLFVTIQVVPEPESNASPSAAPA